MLSESFEVRTAVMSEPAEAPRETMAFDVIIVGAGPAGLAAACRLAQCAAERGSALSIAVVEKGAEVGAHIVSGALFDPRPLTELFPDWRERGAPVDLAVAMERVAWLPNARRSVPVPRAAVPASLHNGGHYIVSLGELCRWLAAQAEALGVTILPGFAAAEPLYDGEGRVAGVVTGDRGRARSGAPKPNFERGYALEAKYTIFAEGCRGHLGQVLEERYGLRRGRAVQHYGLGFKEVWEVDPARHRPGEVLHTIGWPLPADTDGGGFLYHAGDGRVSVGLIVSLGYRNPHLAPFAEFQRFKHHPLIATTLQGGRRIGYGARAVNKGGLHAIPELVFPGGVLVGCEAGFLDGAKMKGTHTAMKSGLLAAEAVFEALAAGDPGGGVLTGFEQRVRRSWLWTELSAARNFGAGFSRFGRFGGAALAFVEQNLLRGRAPWTLRDPVPDRARLVRADAAPRIEYPPPDGVLSFDRLSSVHLANVHHDDDQPVHLRLVDPRTPIAKNLPRFDEPAQRYCPAGVYEIVVEAAGPRFQINAGNCIHCKACDIKDPAGNIIWVAPEGGSGPLYTRM